MSPDSIRHEVIFHHTRGSAHGLHELIVECLTEPQELFSVTLRVAGLQLSTKLLDEDAKMLGFKIREALRREEPRQ